MNIKKSQNRKRLILSLSAVLAIVLLTAWYAYAANLWPFAKSANNAAEQLQENPASKNELDSSPSGSDTRTTTDTDTKTPIQNDSVDSSKQNRSQLQVAITSAQQNGSKVSIRTLIESVTTGTCNLSMKNASSSETISKQASIQALSNSSTCEGFDIPTSELSDGTWKFTVTVKTSSASGSASGSVEVKL